MNEDVFKDLLEGLVYKHINHIIKLKHDIICSLDSIHNLYKKYDAYEQRLLQDSDSKELNRHRKCACLCASIIECKPLISMSESKKASKPIHTSLSIIANYRLGLDAAMDLLLHYMKNDAQYIGTSIARAQFLEWPPSISDGHCTDYNLVGILLRQLNRHKEIDVAMLSAIFNMTEAWHSATLTVERKLYEGG